jgi:hypothetical protein
MNDDDGTLPSFVAASLRDRVPGKAYAPDAPYAPSAWPSWACWLAGPMLEP